MFMVPKKVIRHIVKAMKYMHQDDDPIYMEDILNQVKYQMRNLCPLTDANPVISTGVRQLVAEGVLKSIGEAFVLVELPDTSQQRTTDEETEIAIHMGDENAVGKCCFKKNLNEPRLWWCG